MGKTEPLSGPTCPCLQNGGVRLDSLEDPSSEACVLGAALAVSRLLARAWGWKWKEGDAARRMWQGKHRQGCSSSGRLHSSLQRCLWGRPGDCFPHHMGFLGNLKFSLDPNTARLGMVLPHVRMTRVCLRAAGKEVHSGIL